jgi:hypothetical protein
MSQTSWGEAVSPTDIEMPQRVKLDPTAEEILRVWATDGDQVFSLRLGRWSDPAAWGILLADLARHVARSFAEEGSRSEPGALERVLAGFHAEFDPRRDG